MPLIIGADLALRHGAIVDINGNVLFCYEGRPGLNTSFEQLFQTARECANATPSKALVCIDLDRTQGSWDKDYPSTGTLLTMLSAFYAALVRTKKCHVQFCSPNTVRLCLGLAAFCPKEDVHWTVRDFVPEGLNDPEGDMIDAWLLALTYQCSRRDNDV